MKLNSFSNVTYLISLAAHLSVLSVFVFIVHEPRPSVRSFQTSVFFESAPVKQTAIRFTRQEQLTRGQLDDIPLSRKHKRAPSIRKKKADLPKSRTNKSLSLKKYITPPKAKALRELDQPGYLRANKRTKQPVLPMIAATPTPKNRLQPEIKDADLSGSALTDSDKARSVLERPFIPSPGYTDNSKRNKKSPKQRVSSIWQRKSDLNIYRNSLAKLVTANWIVPPTKVKTFQIMIEAYISPRGNLLSIHRLKSSGLAVLDAAAERAIRVSTPFPEFPTSFDKTQKSYRAVFRFTPDKVAN